MNWNKYRRNSGSIDLISVFNDSPEREWMELDQINRATAFLARAEEMQDIISKQAAAIAISTAINLAFLPLDGE